MNQRIRALRELGEGFERLRQAEAERPPARPERRVLRRLPALGTALTVAVALAVAAGALILIGHGGGSSPAGGPGGGTPPTAAQIRQEGRYISIAAREARRSGGCRSAPLRGPFASLRQPTFLGGAPSSALTSELGVLRSPASAADRPPPELLNGLDGVYRGYVRRALVLDGVSYWVVAERSQPHGGFSPACARLETALLHKELPQIPASLRTPTEKLNARLMRFDTVRPVPTDVICLEFHGHTSGGGSCGVTAADIQSGRALTQEPGKEVGIVPDGVASVTLTAGTPAVSDTVQVSNNLFVAPARYGRQTSTITWRSAQGRAIRRSITEGANGNGSCAQSPSLCAAPSGFSSASESSSAAAQR